MSGLLPRLVLGGCLVGSIWGCGQSLEDVTNKITETSKTAALNDVSDKVGETVESVKQSASNVTESAKQLAQVAGNMKLEMGQSVDVSGCYIQVHSVPNRSGVLQVTSYNDADNERFPSVLLRSETSVDAASLAGQTILAEAYVMPSSDGPLWHSTSDHPLQIEFTKTADGELAGAVTAGKLINAQTGDVVSVTGSLQGPAPQ